MINIKLHIKYHIYSILNIHLHSTGKYMCGFGIPRKGFSGPWRTFGQQSRCIYTGCDFLGYASVFPFTVGKCRMGVGPNPYHVG